MDKKEFTMETARMLYLKLPFWKRRKFFKWYKSNNWDVKNILKDCILEAKAIYIEIARGINKEK